MEGRPGEIGDLEIRPCSPPNRRILQLSRARHRRGLSAVIEQDELDDTRETLASPQQPNPQLLTEIDTSDATNFVFHDVHGRPHELVLSEYQEVLLCHLFTDDVKRRQGQGSKSGGFQENSKLDGTVQYSTGAYIYFREKGVTHRIDLTPRQTEALWETRNPDCDWTSSPTPRCPPKRVTVKKVKKKHVKLGRSLFCGLPLKAKLQKQNRRQKNVNKPRRGYAKHWSRKGFVSYVEGNRLHFRHFGRGPASSTRFSKASSLFIEHTRGVDAAFQYALNRLKKVEERGREADHPVPIWHSPICVFGNPPSVDLYLKRHRSRFNPKNTFKALKNLVKRMDPLHPSPELLPFPAWNPPECEFEADTDRHAKIRKWLVDQELAANDPDNLVALTGRELARLRHKLANKYQVVKPDYQVPPPSASSSYCRRQAKGEIEVEDEDEEDDDDEYYEYDEYDESDDDERDDDEGNEGEGDDDGEDDGDEDDGDDSHFENQARGYDEDPDSQDGDHGDAQSDGQGDPQGDGQGDAQGDGHDDDQVDGHDDSEDDTQKDAKSDAQDHLQDDAHDESLGEAKDKVQGDAHDNTQDETHNEAYRDIQDDAHHHEVQDGAQEGVHAEYPNSEFETKSEEERENLNELRRVLLAAEQAYRELESDTLIENGVERETASITTASDTKQARREEREKKNLQVSIPETAVESEQDVTSLGDTPPSSSVIDYYPVQVEDDMAAGFEIPAMQPGDEEYLRKHQLLDLRYVKPHYSGYYIVCPIRHQSLTEARLNYSDHYSQLMIDPRDGSKIVLGKGCPPGSPDTNFSRDYDPDDYLSDEDTLDDDFPNHVHAPRAQAPAQAVLLYLIFKGYHIDDIATEMSVLDAEFLYKSENRWWKKTRVPQLWQMNERAVDQIMLVAKADKQWWEEDVGPDGREITEAMKTMQYRVRIKNVKKLARKAAENYFWWRFMAQRIHCEIPGGFMIRPLDH